MSLIKNKRGVTNSLGIFIFIFVAFMWIVFLGIQVTVFNLTTTNLDIDIDAGNVNLGEIVQDTLGQINTGILSSADFIGYTLLFGMVLFMFGNAYFFRGTYPKMMMVADSLILVFVYVLAIYLSNAYETLIHSTTILSAYIDNLPKSSQFILRLPMFVSIIGVIIMILSYSGFPKTSEGEASVGEFN